MPPYIKNDVLNGGKLNPSREPARIDIIRDLNFVFLGSKFNPYGNEP
jgi:hypothetical protein